MRAFGRGGGIAAIGLARSGGTGGILLTSLIQGTAPIANKSQPKSPEGNSLKFPFFRAGARSQGSFSRLRSAFSLAWVFP